VTAQEVRAAMAALGINTHDLAQEAGVTARTVNRWLEDGADGCPEAFLRLLLRLHQRGVDWRRFPGTLYI
jgi:transcriptional regulator with XRE-family HTH domain